MPNTPEEDAEARRIREARFNERFDEWRCIKCGYEAASQSCYESCGAGNSVTNKRRPDKSQ